MDPETEKIIKEQWENIPSEIKTSIFQPGFEKEITKIGEKNKLDSEQLATFQLETILMMFCLITFEDYSNELKNKLNLSEENFKNLIKDIETLIPNEIKEKLKNVYENTNKIIKNENLNKTDVENIKNKIKDKKTSWDQNINFILSGGDYSVFLKEPIIHINMIDTPIPEKTPINYSKIEDLKNKFTI